MHGFLLDRPPWYVGGALMAAIVVGLLATLGERIGVLGGYSDLVERIEGRSDRLGWKSWFLFGVVGGGFAFAALSGAWHRASYDWLSGHVGTALLGPVLVGAGVLIGFGAKTAGGCTSGNGIGGCSVGSPASFVATGTFMGTAVAASLLVRWLV